MSRAMTDDHIELNYELDDFRDPWKGGGELILLHHGFGKSLKWWTQWVPALARRYRVLRYDVRGCGESSVPPAGAIWSTERLVQDALNLIDELKIDKVHWVGFESGGLFGMAFAAAYPQRTRSLTTIGTPFATTSDRQTALREHLRNIDKHGIRGWLLDWMKWGDTIVPPGLIEWMLSEMEKTPVDVAKAIMNVVVEGGNFSEQARRVLAPTLIMVGEKDGNCPADGQRELQHHVPNAREVVFIPGVGRSAYLLMPERCTEQVLGFLESI